MAFIEYPAHIRPERQDVIIQKPIVEGDVDRLFGTTQNRFSHQGNFYQFECSYKNLSPADFNTLSGYIEKLLEGNFSTLPIWAFSTEEETTIYLTNPINLNTNPPDIQLNIFGIALINVVLGISNQLIIPAFRYFTLFIDGVNRLYKANDKDIYVDGLGKIIADVNNPTAPSFKPGIAHLSSTNNVAIKTGLPLCDVSIVEEPRYSRRSTIGDITIIFNQFY